MKALVRAELLKVRTVPLLPAVVASSIAVTGLVLGLQLVNAGRAGTPSFGTAQGAIAVLAAGSRSALVAIVLGIVMVTAEFRHATITTTLVITPSRAAVIVAKIIAAALLGLLVAVITMLLSTGVGLFTGAISVAAANAAVLQTVIGLAIVIPLYAVLGVGFGTLVSNQTVAVATALVWLLVGETLLGSYGLRWLLPWTIGGASAAVGQDATLVGALPPWAGALILLAYGLGFAAIGGWRLDRGDVA